MSHIRAKFESIDFDCLLNINEQIVPRFVLEFYSQLTFDYNSTGHFVVNFVIQSKSFSLTLEEFGQILKIPFKGHVSHTDMWSLDYLSISVPSKGRYKTTPPSLSVVKSFIQIPRQGQVTRTRNKKTIVVDKNKILTRKIQPHMKPWVDIIHENAIYLGGHKDHVSAYLYHMLYCIETSTQYNLAFCVLKRMEKTRSKPKELLPYGMLLTRLFKYDVSIFPELEIDRYISHDRNGKSDRKCFRCGNPNHLIGECPKPSKDKNQRAFVGGSWSDSGEEDDEKVKNKTCLVAHASSEVCSESSYFSDENSSIDELALDNEYDKLCKMSLKIITKNNRLKATRNSLKNELRELKDKLSTLEKNKGVDLDCANCHTFKIEFEKLKEESTRLNKFKKSTHCLNEMLSNQKPFGDKLVLGFNSFEASSSGTKEIKFVKAQKMVSSDRGPINMGDPQSA
ncbi:pentatricopeptide repeat-containing protein [Tanacetum coccineum]